MSCKGFVRLGTGLSKFDSPHGTKGTGLILSLGSF